MATVEQYRINSEIIYDTIEGEVILLNLETGSYYQLTASAVEVWHALERGAPVSTIAAHLAQTYGLDPAHVRQALEPFLNELQTENVLQPADDAPSASPPLDPPAGSEFAPPIVLKYTDMQSLLLLDPVHDVDSQGWPILKPNTPPA